MKAVFRELYNVYVLFGSFIRSFIRKPARLLNLILITAKSNPLESAHQLGSQDPWKCTNHDHTNILYLQPIMILHLCAIKSRLFDFCGTFGILSYFRVLYTPEFRKVSGQTKLNAFIKTFQNDHAVYSIGYYNFTIPDTWSRNKFIVPLKKAIEWHVEASLIKLIINRRFKIVYRG